MGNGNVFEVEVTDLKDDEQEVEQGDKEEQVKAIGLNCGGRQENSLRTVRSISQVLYTNTGWSVYIYLGQAYILKWVAHTLGQVQIQWTGGL